MFSEILTNVIILSEMPQQRTLGLAQLHNGQAQFVISVNLSLGYEFYPLQRGFRSFVNSAWISRGFCVDTNKC